MIKILFLLVSLARASFDLDLSPQLEFVGSTADIQAERGIFEAKSRLKTTHFLFNVEGFGIADAASSAMPDLRNERGYAALQEAYIEYRYKGFSLRVGKQPVRWSESWSLPSLDIWTARRWNQLFFLPVNYQLIHSTGALATLNIKDTSLSAFVSPWPVYDMYPPGYFGAPPTKSGAEFGGRLKQRYWGFDFSLVAAHQPKANTFGGNISYAFDWVVPKLEGGGDDQQDGFFTAGLDFFFGQWSILPQFTVFTAPQLPYEYERLFYIPVRFSNDKHTIEVSAYVNADSLDQFYSALYTYNFSQYFQGTIYYQNYFGLPGDLFGYYAFLTDENVLGIRIGSNFSL